MRIGPFALTLLLALTACEAEMHLEAAAAPDLAAVDLAETSAGSLDTRPLGHLEIGFYARQCQWDACNPPPDRRGVDSEDR